MLLLLLYPKHVIKPSGYNLGCYSSLCKKFLYWAWLTIYRITFQVQSRHRWAALIRSRNCEESHIMAL